MKYILDFDRTLFDVEALYQQLDRTNARHLAGTTDSFKTVSMADLLYPDVTDWLQQKPIEDLYILSSSSGLTGEWERDYQREKIIATGVGALVAEVIVVQGEKGGSAAEIAKRFPPSDRIVFIDDRIEQCLSVQMCVPRAQCCLMVRNKDVIGDISQVRGIQVVHDLSTVDAIINNI